MLLIAPTVQFGLFSASSSSSFAQSAASNGQVGAEGYSVSQSTSTSAATQLVVGASAVFALAAALLASLL